MGNSIIGALRVTLGLDTADFEKGAGKAKHEAAGLRGELGKLAKEMAPLVFEVGAVTAAVELFKEGLEKAGETAKYAYDLIGQKQKLGIGVEALQELRHAGEESHIPLEALESGLNGLNSTLGALRTRVGDGRIRKAFNDLGISQAQLKSMKDADDLLPLLADRLVALGNHADQVQIAKKLQVEELLPLLLKGSKGIEELRGEAQKLGLVMDGQTVEALAEMNRQMHVADERSEAAGRRLSQNLVPVLRDIKNAAADAAGALASMLSWANAHDDNNNDFKMKRLLMSAQAYRGRAATIRTGSAWDAMWAGNVSGLEMMQPGWRDRAADRQEKMAAEIDKQVEKLSEKIVADAAAAAEKARAEAVDNAGGNSAFKLNAPGKKLSPWGKLWTVADPLEIDRSTIVDPAKIPIKENELIDKQTAQMEEAARDGTMKGIAEAIERDKTRVREMWHDTIEGGVSSFVYGGGKGLMRYLADVFRQRLIERLSDKLFNFFDGGSKGTGVGASIGDALKGLLGFASGGSFRVGGSGGVDSQLVAFRASPDERVTVTRPGQGAGGPMMLQVNVHAAGAFTRGDMERAVETGAATAFAAARQQVPDDLAKQQKYSLG